MRNARPQRQRLEELMTLCDDKRPGTPSFDRFGGDARAAMSGAGQGSPAGVDGSMGEKWILREVELRIELGERLCQTGDHVEAREQLEVVARIFRGQPFQLPSGTQLVEMVASLFEATKFDGAKNGQGSPITRSLHLWNLHRRLYQALANACEPTDPASARIYTELLSALEVQRTDSQTVDRLVSAVTRTFGGRA